MISLIKKKDINPQDKSTLYFPVFKFRLQNHYLLLVPSLCKI